MRTLGVKKYIITIWVLITTLVFSCFGLFLSNVINSTSEQTKNVEAASTWSGSGTAGDPYLITNSKTLKALADNVNSGETYADTYFELTNSFYYSIDYSNIFPGIGVYGTSNGTYNVQHYFAGHFNGNGHTISEFEIVKPPRALLDASDYSTGINVTCLGFFACLGSGAVVENLKLKDFRLTIQYKENQLSGLTSDPTLLVGGIAGGYLGTAISGSYYSVEIKECSVEGMTITQTGSPDDYNVCIGGYVGSIVDSSLSGKLQINDCMLEDATISNVDNINLLQNEGYDIVGALIGNTYNGKANLIDCVVAGTNTDYLVAYANGNFAYGNDVNSSATNVYLTKQSSYTLCSMSSTGGASGTIWYSYSEYNDGVPYLRVFMSWKTVEFTAENGTVDKSSIEIPSDVTTTYSSTNETITVYGQTITATPNTGYKLEDGTGWVCDSVTSYTITFVLDKCDITFAVVSYVKASYSVAGASFVEMSASYSQNVTVGTEIKISFTEYSKSGCYSACQFSFTNSSGQAVVVKYAISNAKYYIEGYKNATDVLTNTSTTIENVTTFSVETELKTYGTTFK